VHTKHTAKRLRGARIPTQSRLACEKTGYRRHRRGAGVVEGNLRDRLRSLSVDAQRDLTSEATVRPALRVSPHYRQPKFIIAYMIHPL
jgi:hypothetical protein